MIFLKIGSNLFKSVA